MAGNLARRISQLPLARAGRPDEVAATVLWLCSDGATYVAGSIVHVGGTSHDPDSLIDRRSHSGLGVYWHLVLQQSMQPGVQGAGNGEQLV
jgi:hypothetical protein